MGLQARITLEIDFDNSNQADFAVDSGGNLSITASGGNIDFGNENITIGGNLTIDTSLLHINTTDNTLGWNTLTPFGEWDLILTSGIPQFTLTRAGGNGPVFGSRQAQGTPASPTATQSGDRLFLWNAGGYTGINYMTAAAFGFFAEETFSTSQLGTYINFQTVSLGTTSRTEKMRLTADGFLLIGTTSDNDSEKLQVDGYTYLDGILKVTNKARELLEGGDFVGGSGWTEGAGWNVSGGTATYIDAEGTGGGGNLSRPVSVTNGATYTVVYTGTYDQDDPGGVDCNMRVVLGGTAGTTRTSTNTYTENIVAGGSGIIEFEPINDDDTDDEWEIDNVSVVEAFPSTKIGDGGTTDYTEIDSSGIIITHGDSRLQLTQKAGTAVDGDLWNDSTQEALQTFVSGIEQTLVGVIFTQTADKTIADTTDETTLFGTGVGTLTLPANFWVVGKTLRIEIHGDFADAGNPTAQIRVKLDAVELSDSTAIALSGLAGTEEWETEVIITCRSVGGSGTLETVVDWEYETSVGSSAIERLDIGGTLQTVDTTQSDTLDITFEWGTAAAANTLVSEVGFVTVLN